MVFTQAFSSIGIGLLVGILLGLSASPVVGLVVGSITALLASLLGIRIPGKGGESDGTATIHDAQQKLIGIRAGLFGLTCIIGLFAGIYMRTHNVLSPAEPTLKNQFDELTGIGFSNDDARQILMGTISNQASGRGDTSPTSNETVLFSIDSASCEQIAVDRFESFAAAANYYQQNHPYLLAVTSAVDQYARSENGKKGIMRSVIGVICESD